MNKKVIILAIASCGIISAYAADVPTGPSAGAGSSDGPASFLPSTPMVPTRTLADITSRFPDLITKELETSSGEMCFTQADGTLVTFGTKDVLGHHYPRTDWVHFPHLSDCLKDTPREALSYLLGWIINDPANFLAPAWNIEAISEVLAWASELHEAAPLSAEELSTINHIILTHLGFHTHYTDRINREDLSFLLGNGSLLSQELVNSIVTQSGYPAGVSQIALVRPDLVREEWHDAAFDTLSKGALPVSPALTTENELIAYCKQWPKRLTIANRERLREIQESFHSESGQMNSVEYDLRIALAISNILSS